MREGDNPIAIVAGIIFMLILSWFPPFGIIIAGFLIGFISADPRDGAIISAILASIGALIQVAFVTRVLPLLGAGIATIGIVPISITGLLTTVFGPISQIFFGVGGLLAGNVPAQSLALLLLYAVLGATGGFIGGLVR